MKAFLGINYIISINKLPTIKSNWKCGQFIGNEGIRNVMAISRLEDTFYKISIVQKTQKMTKVTNWYKVRSLINHFNQSLTNSVSNDDSQSIGEHMVHSKVDSSMKQYVKNKPIKWGFKFWYRCANETGYLSQFNLYLGKKESVKENLESSVALRMTVPFKIVTVWFF